MPVKPFLMADMRNNKGAPASPASFHRSHVGSGMYNRFEPLSPRVFSFGKRLLSNDEAEGNAAKLPRFDANKIFDQLKEHDTAAEAARTAIKVADAAIASCCNKEDGGLGTALFNLSAALSSILKGNEVLKSAVLDSCKVPPAAAASQAPKKPQVQAKSVPDKPPKPQPSEEEIAVSKVKKALREVEKKTVIFDLNLGPVPTINKETISRKVTIALHEKGKEGNHDWALQDAAEMLDDVLSCSQLEFLGQGTKKFYNKKNAKDARNGKMCTVPVRLEFKNKETRFQAEDTIRKLCKVRCSVPYPKKLREILAATIQEGKKMRPDSYIRTKVDIDNMSISASARSGEGWEKLDRLTQNIPLDILDRSDPLADLQSQMNVAEDGQVS